MNIPLRQWCAAVSRSILGRAGGPESARRGRLGEQLAARHLERERSFRVVARNWRKGRDEIDLVCRDGDVLVFVEVRARASGALVSGYHSVTRGKKKVLLRACRAYLRSLRTRPRHFRFDIVEVRLSNDGRENEVRHYANVPLFHKHDGRGNP